MFLKGDFSDESPVNLFPFTRCFKFFCFFNFSAVNCLARDVNIPNFIQQKSLYQFPTTFTECMEHSTMWRVEEVTIMFS